MFDSVLTVFLILFLPICATVAGWLLWGRPLRAAGQRYEEKCAELNVSRIAEAAARTEAETARPHVERATRLETELATARAQLEERQQAAAAAATERERHFQERLTEREQFHQEQMAALKAEFGKLASEALDRAQSRFTEQAAETLKLHRSEAEKGLSASKEAFAKLVEPMRETLGRYGEELKSLESKREQAYGSITEQLASVQAGQQAVSREATKLVSALRSSSKASGAWGEAQLRNVLDMAGLREGIDFILQTSTTDEDGKRRRPDAILKLPGGRELVVDAKCSLADYLAAFEVESEQERAELLKRHAASLRIHARGLAERGYWKEFAQSADFVVLFVPGENFLSAALEQDLDLLGWAFDQRIILAGPTNLLAIARIVAMVWRQEKMAEEARAIGELGAELYNSLATMTDHVARVGSNLGQATDAYNKFIGSLELRVLSKARKFPELGVEIGKKEVADLAPVDRTIRHVQSPELQGSSVAPSVSPSVALPAADPAPADAEEGQLDG